MLVVLAGHLEAHAAGAAVVQADQFKRGAPVGLRERRKDHLAPLAPSRNDVQQPHAAQEVNLESSWKETSI